MVLTNRFRDNLKVRLISCGLPAELACEFSRQAQLWSYVATDDILLYPYEKLVDRAAKVKSLGIFAYRDPRLKKAQLPGTLEGHPTYYRVYRKGDGWCYLLESTRTEKPWAGPIKVNPGMDGDKGFKGHFLLPGGCLRMDLLWVFPANIPVPNGNGQILVSNLSSSEDQEALCQAQPGARTLVQTAYQLDCLQLAEWLQSRGCLHPLWLKQELRQQSTGAPPENKDANGGDPTVQPDGPQDPYYLWLNGEKHQIGDARKQQAFKLLRFFWKRDCASFDDLYGPGKPFPDPVDDSTIKSAVTRFKTEMPTGFPWKLRTSNRQVFKEFHENPPVQPTRN